MAKRKSLRKTLGKAALKVKHGATGVWNKLTTMKGSKKATLPDDNYMMTDDMNVKVKGVKKGKDAVGAKPVQATGKLAKLKMAVWRIKNKASR